MATNYNFAELLPATISGIVFVDQNNTGQYQSGDALISNVTIDLLNSAGSQVAQTTTDANGAYSFTGLAPSSYSVQEIQPAGYYAGGSQVGTAGGQTSGDNLITGAPLTYFATASGYNFYEVLGATISGYVFQDGAPLSLAAALRIPISRSLKPPATPVN